MLYSIGPKPNWVVDLLFTDLPQHGMHYQIIKDFPNPSTFKFNLKQSKQTVMNINCRKGGNVTQHETRFLLLLKNFY